MKAVSLDILSYRKIKKKEQKNCNKVIMCYDCKCIGLRIEECAKTRVSRDPKHLKHSF